MSSNHDPLLPRQKRSSRDAILEAGSQVFAQRGLSGARVEEIVQRSGVNVRMLYHHFGSKEGLYEEVVSRLLNLQAISSDREEFECSVNWLRHQHAKLVRFFSESPDSLSILTWELAEQRSGEAEKTGARIVIPILAEPIAYVMADGLVHSSKEPDDLAALMIHHAAFVLRLSSAGPLGEIQDQTVEQLADQLWQTGSREILNLSPHPV